MTTSLNRTKTLYGANLGTAELTRQMSPSLLQEDISINKDMTVEQRWSAIEGHRKVDRTALLSGEEYRQVRIFNSYFSLSCIYTPLAVEATRAASVVAIGTTKLPFACSGTGVSELEKQSKLLKLHT